MESNQYQSQKRAEIFGPSPVRTHVIQHFFPVLPGSAGFTNIFPVGLSEPYLYCYLPPFFICMACLSKISFGAQWIKLVLF